jgi:phage gp29-like protein
MPKILDQYGQTIDMAALRQPQTEQLSMVRSLHSEQDEHPARGLTPARIHQIMREAEQGQMLRQVELADDMEERDPQIFSELAKRKNGILKLDWAIEAPEDADAAEQKMAEQVEAWIKALPNFKRTVMFNMLDGILKGFSAVEMWWELQEGSLQPRFAYRPQRWFTLNQDRDRITLRNNSAYGEALQPYNWILHKHPARSGYPARQALSRVLMFPYLYKNYSTRDLAEFLEIYGLPLRLGKYPSGASDKEKLTLLRAVTDIGHNAAGIIPMGMELEFQNAATGTEAPFEAMLNRMDDAISKAIIGQTLTSSQGKHGSNALGNVHNEIRLDILASDAALVAESITSQLIAPLCLLNIAGANPRRLPRFVLEVPEPEDIKLLSEAYPALANAGLKIGVKWVAQKLRIPEPDKDEEVLQAAALPAAPGMPSAPGAPTPASKPDAAHTPPPTPPTPAAAPPQDKAAQAAQMTLATLRTALLAMQAAPAPRPAVRDALDDLIDDSTANYQPIMRPLVQPLLDELQGAINKGESIEAFAAKLPGLFARMDASAFGDRAAKAAFMARLAGEADLELDK